MIREDRSNTCFKTEVKNWVTHLYCKIEQEGEGGYGFWEHFISILGVLKEHFLIILVA